MAILSMLLFSAVVVGANAQGQYLYPQQDLLLPSSDSASSPLEWLGANSPWFAGPNVNGVSSDVPEGCSVQQAAVISRHGSRYPDSGAYGEWEDLYYKIGNASFTASGSLEFLKSWKPVLSNPTLQIAQESITGYKEAHDLGYALRVRYPSFYTYGSQFMVWANLYPRVVQTAVNFLHGYLGSTAQQLGTVYTINSTGSIDALGNSLSPSDQCPNFDDSNGAPYTTDWAALYLPPITARLNSLISGNLTFTNSDISLFPYLCGYESQITGTLSPWCSTFNDTELKQYEYAQDLRYYYGLGPGTDLEKTMMLPFLNSLVSLFQSGPGVQGKYANGSFYTVPNLIVAFLNDGQIAELTAATGVFDEQSPLPNDTIPEDWLYKASHFVTQRGATIFEVLNCSFATSSTNSSGAWNHTGSYNYTGSYNASTTTHEERYIRILLNDAVYPVPSCQNGPGKSCRLDDYVHFVGQRYNASGSWTKNCNVTTPGAPSTVKGASFFTDLAGPEWIDQVRP